MTVGLWSVSLIALLFSLYKKPLETKSALGMASKMIKNMLIQIVGILFLIGFMLSMLPPELIKGVLGSSNQLFSTVAGALLGSVTIIPAFVAFPLVASFLKLGASVLPAIAFLTTLTMVGIATFPIEKEAFGLKFTLVRNGLSFVFAIIIAFSMGVILR
ncbi:permease [Fusibacter ferrireducens]|uniref:Permease n=1 Tax=Fusibacter ferrireducens TaxID=2785058 RepID=A0ABR9ZPQ5_9FIRM|nr:permease [Fusibacter ferrireducens]MBF4692427.1 permease [Fusibacter ferrireducens]